MPVPILIAVATATAMTAVAVGVSYAFSADARTRRALKKRRTVPIRGLREGEIARVRGRVIDTGDRLMAPLSSRTCVYYLATIEQHHGKAGWRPIAREERKVDFEIDDGTGRMRVCMSVPQVAVVHDVHTRSGTFDDANEVEVALLSRHGLKSTNFLDLNLALRYTEGVIEPGEEVTALGKVRAEVRGGQRVLVLDALDDSPLLLSDDPRAVTAP